MKLWEIAHARTGDKGNIANIVLVVYDKTHFELVREKVTAEKVKQWFHQLVKGNVVRYELPQLGAFNFVLYEALAGGVTSSTALDKHGKSLSSFLLDMDL